MALVPASSDSKIPISFGNLVTLTMGTAVSISDLSWYTCPSDGYFIINSSGVQKKFCYGYIRTGDTTYQKVMGIGTPLTMNSEADPTASLYVRKGMQIAFFGTSGDATGCFLPLNS